MKGLVIQTITPPQVVALNEYLTPSFSFQWRKGTTQEQTRMGMHRSSALPVLTARKLGMVKWYQIVKVKSIVEFLPHVKVRYNVIGHQRRRPHGSFTWGVNELKVWKKVV